MNYSYIAHIAHSVKWKWFVVQICGFVAFAEVNWASQHCNWTLSPWFLPLHNPYIIITNLYNYSAILHQYC